MSLVISVMKYCPNDGRRRYGQLKTLGEVSVLGVLCWETFVRHLQSRGAYKDNILSLGALKRAIGCAGHFKKMLLPGSTPPPTSG